MKILIVNTLYPPSTVGGAERSVALLARAVAARGHEVHVACLHDGDDVVIEQDEGVTVNRLPLRNFYWPFESGQRRSLIARTAWHVRDRRNRQATQDLIDLAESIKPDVLHTNNLQGFSTEIWEWAQHNDVRVVHTLRDYSLLCARATLFRNGNDCETRCMECRMLTARKKANTSAVDVVASNSRYVIDAHEREGYFSDTPSAVIFNIADVKGAIHARPDDGEALVFGVIGRVEPEKGIEVVLAAFASLPAGRPWRLRVAGSGRTDYVDGLKEQYPDPRIEWLGFAQADAFYDSVDVVIIPSIWPEPLPRTMIETLARGAPTLYSDAGGTPEIGHLAPLGAIYAKDDAQALAARIGDALDHADTWRMRRPVDPGVLREFSEERVASRYLDLYEPEHVIA